MYIQVLSLLAVVATVYGEAGHSSQYVVKHDDHPQPVTIHDKHGHHHVDYYTEPKYEFKYEVKDPHTHDAHEQHEHRHGDVVKGHYSLHEPDGNIRHVHYHADKHTGFHADVKHSTHHEHHHKKHHEEPHHHHHEEPHHHHHEEPHHHHHEEPHHHHHEEPHHHEEHHGGHIDYFHDHY